MAIDLKNPQTLLAIILIIAAIVGPIFFRERMLWKLDESLAREEEDIKDLQKRMIEAETKLREREVLFNQLKALYGEGAPYGNPYDKH